MTYFNPETRIKYNSSTMNDEFIIYEVFDFSISEKVYIGCCPTLQFMTLPDLRQNPLFRANAEYGVMPLGIYPNKKEALHQRATLINAGKMPHYNKFGYLLKRGRIVCDQTGESFNTINEAAKANFCSASNLTNHLNNKPGYNSVKGKTFRYKNSD